MKKSRSRTWSSTLKLRPSAILVLVVTGKGISFTKIQSDSPPRFVITLEELDEGEDIAHCPSCTLKIRVIYEPEVIEKYKDKGESKER